MNILSSVDPILAPFKMSVDTLKRFSQIVARTGLRQVSLFVHIVLLCLRSLLARTSSSDHFPSWNWCQIYRHLPYISSCEWYVMTLRYHITIIQNLVYRSLLGILHRMFLLIIGCQRHRLYILLASPKNQQPCDLLYHSCFIPCWIRAFFQYYCRFFFSFSFSQKSDAMWPYLTHLLHSPLRNLLFLFIRLFSLEFSARTSSSGYVFSFVFPPFFSVLQDQRNSFFGSLNCILVTTMTCVYASGKTSNTYALSSSSSFSYFFLIFLNLRLKLYISSNQMSKRKLVSLIL